MSFSSNGRRPSGLKPVRKIELSEEHLKFRTVLVFVCVAVGLTALGVFLFSILNKQPGWQNIEAHSDQVSCSRDFTLRYDLKDDGQSATAVYKRVSAVYSDATEKAFLIFSKDAVSQQADNVQAVNARVNEPVTVDPALYQAFELLDRYKNRSLFLAPIYTEYRNLCSSESEPEAAARDPERNPDQAKYFRSITAFINDPQMIDLELLGNYQVRLKVAREYLDFALEYQIETFLDFDWMSNAFIADYLAEELSRNGLTAGYLVSFDGFTRMLDSRENLYSFNLFDRLDDAVYVAGKMEYSGPMSIVFLRNFSLSDQDRWHYYNWQDGRITVPYVDTADGRQKSARNNLVSSSRDMGCAEILLQTMPVYFGYEPNPASLADQKIYCVWFEKNHLYYNDPGIQIRDLYETDILRFDAVFAK